MTILEALIIFLIGLIPVVCSLMMMRKAETEARNRLRRAMRSSAGYGLRRLQYSSSSDHQYVEGVGYLMGDISCQFNARSPYIRCAINPSGPCQNCRHYQAIVFPEEMSPADRSDRS